MLALEFPPINELIRWQDIYPTFNKVGLIAVLATVIGIVVFIVAGGKDPMVAPTALTLFRNSKPQAINPFSRRQ